MSSKILLRRGTAAEWSSANPILGTGELGIETDTLKIKIGNGSSTWSQLSSYANVTPAQLTSQINSLISAAPSTLDTLNELAAAINNDASFSTTVNNLLTGKVSKSGGDTITPTTTSTIGLTLASPVGQTAHLLYAAGGTRIPAGGNYLVTPGLTVSYTSDFNAGAANIVPISVKGAASQTANLQEWQNSAGTVLAKIDSSGNFTNSIQNSTTLYTQSINSGSLSFAGVSYNGISNPTGVTTLPTFVVKAIASQTANLQEWQNSSGTKLVNISSDGTLEFANGAGNGIKFYGDTARTYWSTLSTYGANLAFNYQFTLTGGFITNAAFPDRQAIVVKGAASQTANLQEWQNSAGTVLAKVDSAGNITATNYNLSNSLYNIKKTLKKTIDPAQNAIAGNTYDLFQIAFPSSLQGIFTMQVSIRNGGYGQSMSYTLPVTYIMDWLSQYGITNPFTDSSTWVDLTPITFAPRHLMTNDYLKFQARVNNNTIFFRIKLTGQLTANPLFDVYIQHSEEFANSTVTELSSTGTDFTTSSVLPNFLSSKAGTTSIFNPLTITSSVAANVPLIIKGAASQTGDLQQWQDSAGTTRARIDAYGTFQNGTASGYGAWVNVQPVNASDKGIVVRAAASQSANLQEWQNSAGSNLATITSSGQVFTPQTLARYFTNRTNSGAYFDSELVSNSFVLEQRTTTAVNLIVKGMASQTGDLQQWQDSAGTVLSVVDSAGRIVLGRGSQLASATFTIQGNTSTYSPDNTSALANRIIFLRGNTGGNLMALTSKGDAAQGVAALVITNGGFSTEITGFGYNGNVYTNLQSATAVGVIIKGAASQTADLQQWQNSSGTALTVIRSDGSFLITKNGDPATATAAPFFYAPVNSGYSPLAVFSFWYQSGTGISNPAAQTLGINTLSIERMRFTSAGLVLINSSSSTLGGGSVASQLGVVVAEATTVGTVIRGAASQTANLQEWQNSAGTIMSSVAYNGTITAPLLIGGSVYAQTGDLAVAYGGYFGGGNPGSYIGAALSVKSWSTTTAGFIIRAIASQTANLQEWQDSTGAVIAKLDPAGGFTTGTPATTNIKLDATAAGAKLHFGTPATFNNYATLGAYSSVFNIEANARSILATVTNSTTTTTLIVKANTSQTADLQQWQNSTGTVMAKITASGALDATAITVNGAAISTGSASGLSDAFMLMGA